MAKNVLIVLADGFEEIEAVTAIDILRRAGLDVRVAGLTSKNVIGSHGITIEADLLLDQYQDQPDAIVLPGGMPGAKNLGESAKLRELIQKLNQKKKHVAAICASPALVLVPAGILSGRQATCFPGYEDQFTKDIRFSPGRVVVDGNVTTSRAPGTAMEFALKLVEQLIDSGSAQSIRESMLINH